MHQRFVHVEVSVSGPCIGGHWILPAAVTRLPIEDQPGDERGRSHRCSEFRTHADRSARHGALRYAPRAGKMRWMSARSLNARRLVAMAAVTLLSLVPVGCSDRGESRVSLPGPITSTTETVTAPRSCSAPAVRDSVERLVAAMNIGEVAAADAVVAPTPRFQWFSVNPERLNADASDRASLREFLGAQVAVGQKTDLISFDFTFYRAEDRTGNFAFRLAQRSREAQPTEAAGKGAVDCDNGLIMVWTVGPRVPSA